jgi:hypothetical protein
MSPDKKERRKHKRYAVDGIQGNVLYPSDMEVLNISIEGAAIETMKRLDLNRIYTLKIKHKDDVLLLKGLVVWSVLTSREIKGSEKTVPVYRAGIKFTDTLNEKTTSLINFIEDNKVKKLEKRVAGLRFKITNPKDVKVDYPCKYEVKKLSLSGMLIETDYQLDIDSRYPVELFIDKDVLNISGRIVTCEKVNSDNGPKYDVGIQFMEISKKDRELLKSFLHSLNNK